MGRMKDLYNNILEANNGMPSGLTVSEYTEMHKLKIYNYEEYKRLKSSQPDFKSEDPSTFGKTK
jgi:hypothetical protein